MHGNQALNHILQQDPGHRGLLNRLPETDLEQVISILRKAERIIITSGFPVYGEGVGETDGPSGAVHIAWALTELGKQVLLVTDPCAAPIMEAARRFRSPRASLLVLQPDDPESQCHQLVRDFSPDVIIALERPGQAADGHFHNMHGTVIDGDICSTDQLFAENVPTIGIGDGGNELGMGVYKDIVERCVPHGSEICSRKKATYPLASGVSNWWGWGLAALLSRVSGKKLLPSDQEEADLLQAVIDAGGLDGVTHRSALSVDNLPLSQHLQVLHQVQDWLDQQEE